jgi:hypothetical protein
MPVLQDWSWQMRKRASADHRDRRGSRVSPMGGAKTPGNKPASIEAGVQAHIGNLLRAMYDSALKEPVPERFLDLLRQMDSNAEAAGDGVPPVIQQPETKRPETE